MLGMFGHQLAPEFERVLSDGMRELVHEAFDVDGVLVDVDAAPETRRHMRVAHRMVDQQIRNFVAEFEFAARRQPLKRRGVHAIL